MAYTDEQKAVALAALEAHRGDIEQTAKYLKIPPSTLRHWAKGDYIQPAHAEKGEEKKCDLATLFESEIRAALGDANDKREDASYRDLMTGIGILTDKVQLLRGQPTSITQSNMSDDERAQRVESILQEARKRKEGYAGK